MIFSSSPILLKWTPERAAADSLLRLFQEGEVIRGTAVNTIDPCHAILKIKGEHLVVETQVDLPKGLTASFVVVQTAPKVVLRVLPESLMEKGPAGWVPRYASRDLPLEELTRRFSGLGGIPPEVLPERAQETFRDLLKLLDAFSPASLPANPDALKRGFIASGLFFESKLRNLIDANRADLFHAVVRGDVKGLLLQLKAQIDSFSRLPGSTERQSAEEEFLEGVDPWIQKIEFYQILNLSQAGPEEKISLLIPFWFQEGLQFIELNLSLPRQEHETAEGKSFSLLFLLDLTHLGRIRIQVTAKGETLFCLFATAQPGVAKAIESLLPDLLARLGRIGFRAHVDVSTAAVMDGPPSLMEARAAASPWVSIVV